VAVKAHPEPEVEIINHREATSGRNHNNRRHLAPMRRLRPMISPTIFPFRELCMAHF
jgi:hypothetical protein